MVAACNRVFVVQSLQGAVVVQKRSAIKMPAPIVDDEYKKCIEKARRDLRAFIAEKNCAPIMLRLAYGLLTIWCFKSRRCCMIALLMTALVRS